MIEQLFKFFVVFFVVVEPISLIPLFAGLTEGASPNYQKSMAFKSSAIALGICSCSRSRARNFSTSWELR